MSVCDPILTEDGWSLAIEHRAAEGTPWGVVVCGHAMMCNRNTLDRPRGEGLVSVLAAAGLETYWVDLRGHGESRRPADENNYTYDDFIHQDIPAIVRAVRERSPGLPLVWVGHSLAAHAAVASLCCDPTLPIDALVSLAGNVWIRELEPGRWMWLLKRSLSETWMGLSRLWGRFPARFLRVGSDDEALPYVRQLVGFSRKGTWGSVDGALDYLALMPGVTTPILSLVGTADTWMCRPESSRFWLAHATNAPITHRVIGVHDGDPQGVDHMGLVLRPDMQAIWEEAIEWMRHAVTPESRVDARAG